MTVHAIFEDGVFKPTSPVDLPERCQVEFEPRRMTASEEAAQEEIYRLLSQSFDGGPPDLAERHNELQP